MRRRAGAPLLAGIAMLLLMALGFAIGPSLTHASGTAVDFGQALRPPSSQHWMGTDNLGRDVLTRVLLGGRVDLQIVAICVALPFLLGSVIGAVSGYAGGWLDRIVMRVVDVLQHAIIALLANLVEITRLRRSVPAAGRDQAAFACSRFSSASRN